METIKCFQCKALLDAYDKDEHAKWHRDFEKRVLEIVRKEATDTSRRRGSGGLG